MLPDPLSGLLSIAIGLGLAAACGFRVFVPLLIAGLAAHQGRLPLADGFTWLATTPALIALGTATVLEIGAYYFPWLDHILDLIATPTAVIAGMLAAGSVVTDLPPLLKWAVALIGGGSIAGLVQAATVMLRLKSTAVTGGAANPGVATAEVVGAGVTAWVAILIPIVGLVLVVVLVYFGVKAVRRAIWGKAVRSKV
ncbi:MAG TPA: DUF4126 domain-containing protein [Gemmatimonadales bacterium]|nr:DUF4126 domain-containing protein [Gemmatimonadales bacterium]